MMLSIIIQLLIQSMNHELITFLFNDRFNSKNIKDDRNVKTIKYINHVIKVKV